MIRASVIKIIEVISKPHPSKAQWLRCRPLQNAHILPCMLRFFIGLRLALEPNLRF
jgi:hypothetical protein